MADLLDRFQFCSDDEADEKPAKTISSILYSGLCPCCHAHVTKTLLYSHLAYCDKAFGVINIIIVCNTEEIKEISKSQNRRRKSKPKKYCGNASEEKGDEPLDTVLLHDVKEENFVESNSSEKIFTKKKNSEGISTKKKNSEGISTKKKNSEGISTKKKNSEGISTKKKNSSPSPNLCSICGRIFRSQKHLISHVGKIHNGQARRPNRDLPFMCEICGKRFNEKPNLKYHMNTHAGIRPFKCNKCQRSWSRPNKVSSHVCRKLKANIIPELNHELLKHQLQGVQNPHELATRSFLSKKSEVTPPIGQQTTENSNNDAQIQKTVSVIGDWSMNSRDVQQNSQHDNIPSNVQTVTSLNSNVTVSHSVTSTQSNDARYRIANYNHSDGTNVSYTCSNFDNSNVTSVNKSNERNAHYSNVVNANQRYSSDIQYNNTANTDDNGVYRYQNYVHSSEQNEDRIIQNVAIEIPANKTVSTTTEKSDSYFVSLVLPSKSTQDCTLAEKESTNNRYAQYSNVHDNVRDAQNSNIPNVHHQNLNSNTPVPGTSETVYIEVNEMQPVIGTQPLMDASRIEIPKTNDNQALYQVLDVSGGNTITLARLDKINETVGTSDDKLHPSYLYSCKNCGKTFKKSNLMQKHACPSAGKEPKVYTCDLCNKVYNSVSGFKYHQLSHTGEKPFKCTECNKCFRASSLLKQHSSTHQKVKNFKCKHCEKTFANPARLKYHEYTHSGYKPFECDICHKRFVEAPQLKYHKNVHLGLKPYQCPKPKCNKSFARPSKLSDHRKTCKC